MDKTRPNWRARQAQRKTAWHATKIILLPISLFLTGYLVLNLMLYIQSLFIANINMSQSGFAELLFLIPLALPIFGLSFIVSNIILICIPPARKAFAKEAENNESLSFKHSMTDLMKMNLKFFLPVGFGLSFIGMYLTVISQ